MSFNEVNPMCCLACFCDFVLLGSQLQFDDYMSVGFTDFRELCGEVAVKFETYFHPRVEDGETIQDLVDYLNRGEVSHGDE